MQTSASLFETEGKAELMSVPPEFPEFPYPLPPGRRPPEPSGPIVAPLVDHAGGIAQDILAEQRRILVSGALDHQAVTLLTAQLMAFDGSSSRDVEVMINSPGGPIPDVFAALDVLGLMRAKVNVTVIGSVSGTAVGLVAACTGDRRAAAHARFSLRLDTRQSLEGTTGDIARQAEELSQLRSRYLSLLAHATGQGETELVEEVDRGGRHTAEEAIEMGIIDAIAGGP